MFLKTCVILFCISSNLVLGRDIPSGDGEVATASRSFMIDAFGCFDIPSDEAEKNNWLNTFKVWINYLMGCADFNRPQSRKEFTNYPIKSSEHTNFNDLHENVEELDPEEVPSHENEDRIVLESNNEVFSPDEWISVRLKNFMSAASIEQPVEFVYPVEYVNTNQNSRHHGTDCYNGDVDETENYEDDSDYKDDSDYEDDSEYEGDDGYERYEDDFSDDYIAVRSTDELPYHSHYSVQHDIGIDLDSHGYFQSQVLGVWLKYHEVRSNWWDARLRCEVEGGLLAWPKDGKFQKEMIGLVASNREEQETFFIGMHSLFSPGDFVALDGTPLSKISHTWGEAYSGSYGQPSYIEDYDQTHRCLTLGQDGYVYEENCENLLTYICYKEKSEVLDVNECGTSDAEYMYYNCTGSCYKFHSSRTWSIGHMTCESEGAQLAVINNDEELRVFKEIFSSQMLNNTNTAHSNVLCLGFHEHFAIGDWRTVEGQTLTEAGYSVWATGQPGESGSCGAMTDDGKLNDMECDQLCYVLCEMKL